MDGCCFGDFLHDGEVFSHVVTEVGVDVGGEDEADEGDAVFLDELGAPVFERVAHLFLVGLGFDRGRGVGDCFFSGVGVDVVGDSTFFSGDDE